jgi:outer membrane protein assembly factor BamA
MMNAQAAQKRLDEIQREKQQLETQLKVQEFASNYEISLNFPAKIQTTRGEPPSTNTELIQHRLLEAGVLYEVPTSLSEVILACNRAVENLQATGCFQAVNIQVNSNQLVVTLDEARWYRLHAGGGIKASELSNTGFGQSNRLPVAEVETSIGLRNLSGYLDTTDLHYAVDSRSLTTWSLIHQRPLYSVLPETLRFAMLERTAGSQYGFVAKAVLDTVDFEMTRSYKEYQRLLSLQAQFPTVSLQWSTILRDIVPRRDPESPFLLQASPAIVSQAGPSVKHGVQLQWDTRPNNAVVATRGSLEVATPPGDVGLGKLQVGVSVTLPRVELDLEAGYLHYLAFGGLCRPPTLSDRFVPHLRGFSPAGIGPRTGSGRGDALGGDAFYSASCLVPLRTLERVRVFGFLQTGTCIGHAATTPWQAMLYSSRISMGIGIETSVLGPKIEVTYGWPLRYGPRDVQRPLQFRVVI